MNLSDCSYEVLLDAGVSKLHRLISSCTCYSCDLFSNIHNNVLFPLRIKDSQKTVKFKDFVDFVKAEAKKANDPTYGKSAMNYSQRDQKPQDACRTADI
jgi:hypothetical protein